MRFVLVVFALVVLGGCGPEHMDTENMVEPPPRTMNQAQLSLGKRVFENNCKKCHGLNGIGAPGWRIQGPDGRYPAPPLNGDGHTWHHPTEVLISVIMDGSPGGMGNMPAFRNKLNEQEVEAVIAWVKSLWPEEAYRMWYQHELGQDGHQWH